MVIIVTTPWGGSRSAEPRDFDAVVTDASTPRVPRTPLCSKAFLVQSPNLISLQLPRFLIEMIERSRWLDSKLIQSPLCATVKMKSKHIFENQYDILQYSLTGNYIFHDKSTADKKVLDKGVWGQHDLVFRQPWLSTISWNTKSDHRQYPRNATTGFLCLKYHHGNTAETSVFHQHLSHPFIHNYDFAIANLFRSKRLRTKSVSPHNPSACRFASSLICFNVSFWGGRCQKCMQLHRPHVYIQLDLLSK